MAVIFYKRVINDIMPIERVPDLWKKEVEEMLLS